MTARSKKFLLWNVLHHNSWLERFFVRKRCFYYPLKNKLNRFNVRVVEGMIPDQISYPHLHFFPIFCFNLRKKGMENPSKSHPFYKPVLRIEKNFMNEHLKDFLKN
jgi:hypothetical protein